jgi:Cu/Ag efflux pump CusA
VCRIAFVDRRDHRHHPAGRIDVAPAAIARLGRREVSSAFAERITGGFYINIEPDREQLARYGLAVGDLQNVIGAALGGEMVTTTVEGRERFGVSVRYPRELRANPQRGKSGSP